MLNSKIQFVNNKPLINVDGTLYPPLAYTTYFEECGQWQDFIDAGYKMFFVNVSFTDLPINNISGFSPFRTGVFENETPDYNEFDGIVQKIVSLCPDALILPRIHISMPRKWLDKNPYETVTTQSKNRESIYSDIFRRDGVEYLKTLVAHIRKQDYAHRIAGYQLCGGTTQEWFHQDLYGSYSEMGIKKFRSWALEKYNIKDIKIPEREDFNSGVVSDEITKYYEFSNEETTKTIEHFAKTLKECVNNSQIVGVFYGYNAFVRDPLWGTHGLSYITDSHYIDFFSSPCAYDDSRNLGLDWGDMLPVDSLKLHNKLSFIECDIRTHLTTRMQNSRPGRYPDNILKLIDDNGNKTVWSGPDTLALSISALRKAFAHQLTKSSGIWWFDMWGGWYHDPEIMSELNKMREITESSKNKLITGCPTAEVVLFIDEKAYWNVPRNSRLSESVTQLRVAMGNTGIPFDIFMAEDAPKVLKNYKCAIFTAPVPTKNSITAMTLCNQMTMPYIAATEDKLFYETSELRNLLISNGVHCYNDDNNVIYCDNGFLGIHTTKDGNVKITLPQKAKIRPLLNAEAEEAETDKIEFYATKHNTYLFEILR